MRSRSPRISPLQVIFTAFPDAARYIGAQITRVRDVTNPDGDRRDQLGVRIRQALAHRITAELARLDRHEALRQQRLTARRNAAAQGGGPAAAPETDLILPAFFDEDPPQPGAAATAGVPSPAMPSVRASEISLIEVTDDSVVRRPHADLPTVSPLPGVRALRSFGPGAPAGYAYLPMLSSGAVDHRANYLYLRALCGDSGTLTPGRARGATCGKAPPPPRRVHGRGTAMPRVRNRAYPPREARHQRG